MGKCCGAPLAPKSHREIGLKNEGLQKWKRQLAAVRICEDGWNLGAMHQTEGPLTPTEIASESPAAQRAGGLWAFHSTTLSRSRLLMLSDCSLKPCNRLFTVRNGATGSLLKNPVSTLSYTQRARPHLAASIPRPRAANDL